jgi:hypothetical protein
MAGCGSSVRVTFAVAAGAAATFVASLTGVAYFDNSSAGQVAEPALTGTAVPPGATLTLEPLPGIELPPLPPLDLGPSVLSQRPSPSAPRAAPVQARAVSPSISAPNQGTVAAAPPSSAPVLVPAPVAKAAAPAPATRKSRAS